MTRMNDAQKEEAMSHMALKENPKLYQGVAPGRSIEEVERNVHLNTHPNSPDSEDENELDAILVQSGVDEVQDTEDIADEDDVDDAEEIARNKDLIAIPEEERDLFLDDVESEEPRVDEEEEEDEFPNREDESDLDDLPHRGPLTAERTL